MEVDSFVPGWAQDLPFITSTKQSRVLRILDMVFVGPNTTWANASCTRLTCPYPFKGIACEQTYASGPFLVHHIIGNGLYFLAFACTGSIAWANIRSRSSNPGCVRTRNFPWFAVHFRLQLLYQIIFASSFLQALNSFDKESYANIKPEWVDSVVENTSIVILILSILIMTSMWISILVGKGTAEGVHPTLKKATILFSLILLVCGVIFPLLEMALVPAEGDGSTGLPPALQGSSITNYKGVVNVLWNTLKNGVNATVAFFYTVSCVFLGYKITSKLKDGAGERVNPEKVKAKMKVWKYILMMALGDLILTTYTIVTAVIKWNRASDGYYYLRIPPCQTMDFYFYPASFSQLVGVALTLFILHHANQTGDVKTKIRDPRSATELSSFDDSTGDHSFDDEHRVSRNSWSPGPEMAANAALVELQQPLSKDRQRW